MYQDINIMKTKNKNIHHLTGYQAYLIYWMQVYECQVKLETVMAIDLNLEVIVDAEGELLSFRYEYPEDMAWMVKNDRQWQYFEKHSLNL